MSEFLYIRRLFFTRTYTYKGTSSEITLGSGPIVDLMLTSSGTWVYFDTGLKTVCL